MYPQIQPLYPHPGAPRALEGLYLDHRLHELGSTRSPFVYGSFVSSLDGRIAVSTAQDLNTNSLQGLSNPADFRLFQELQAQADCLITHGGYLRALAQGKLGNVLQIQAPDLIEWRQRNGLPRQPSIAVASGSLDFPIHRSIEEHGQPLYIATGRDAERAQADALRAAGYQVLYAGDKKMVDGAPLVEALGALGYKTLYLLAGPIMLDTMIRDRKLSRLYLTMRHRLLGGQHFQTMLHGPLLNDAGLLALQALYLDPGERPGDGQWFAQFDCVK